MLHFTGNNRTASTVPLNISSGDSVRFWIAPGDFSGICERPDGGENLYLEYSTNGSNWTLMQSFNNYQTAGVVSFVVPAGAVSSTTQFRLRQSSFSLVAGDNWLIDDFAVISTSGSGAFAPGSGTLTASDSVSISGKLFVGNLTSGTYNRSFKISSNDPVDPLYTVSLNLVVAGESEIKTPAACVAMGNVMVGTASTDSVRIHNSGCADLILSGQTMSNSDFSVNTPVTTIAPGDSAMVFITYTPSGIGVANDTIFMASNDTTGIICLRANGLGAPDITLDTSIVSVTSSACNDSVRVQRTIYNNGQGSLNYEIGGQTDVSLQAVLDTFANSYSDITSIIPSIYLFSEGIYGNRIWDGGNDMYDYGNYLGTNLGTYISYSQNLVAPSTLLGPKGEYFTYKGNGIWLFAAELDGVNDFNISGGLGADGYGNVSATTLNTTVNGKNYTGFVKCVYNAWEPSVNHLVIVESNSSVSHTYSTNTNLDQHSLSGLNSTSRLYYLLYAGTSGAFIDDATTTSIMNKFLNIVHGSQLAGWISVVPDSGQVAVNDSVTIDIWVKTTGLTSGVHNTHINVKTNDPAEPELNIPVQLTLNGAPEISAVNNSACISFTNIQQGATATDSLWIYNSGCDSLDVTGFTGSSTEFGISNLPVQLAPGDSVPLLISFQSQLVGSFTDTLLVQNNDTVLSICVNGTSVGAPMISLPVDTLVVDVNKCKVISNEQFKILNNGQGAMNYTMKFGGYYGESQIAYNTAGATTTHTFNGVPQSDTVRVRIILHGDYDTYYERPYMTLDNTYYYGSVYHNNRFYVNDTIEYTWTGTTAQNWTADGVFTVTLNNNTSVDGNTGSFHRVEVSTSSNVNWVSVIGSTTGSVAANAQASKNILFNAATLSLGTYRTLLNITSNTPGQPVKTVPVVMNVVEEPELSIADTCVFFSKTLLGDTATKILTLHNTGCTPLSVSGIISGNGDFKVSPANGSIPIDDSLQVTISFIPRSVTTYSSSIIINNSDTTAILCLQGVSGAMPIADFQFNYSNTCLGEVLFADETQYSPTSWLWEFGDGNTSTQQNPSHMYAKPGTYKVKLTAFNNTGSDTTTAMVTVNPLYVDFSMTDDTTAAGSVDTVFTNTAVYFSDSSAGPVSWNWNFGDGTTSSIQNPNHSFSNKGKYQVSLEVQDARGCRRTVVKDLFVISDISIDELSIEGHRYDLFPNPGSGVFNLQGSGMEWSQYHLQVFDARGRLIRTITHLPQDDNFSIDLTNLRAGVYQLLILKNNELKGRQSLIIK